MTTTMTPWCAATITISPPIIQRDDRQQRRAVHRACGNDGQLGDHRAGTAATGYLQNQFHKNGFALAVVPMELPAGAVDVARKSYKGLSARVAPYYDGTNDQSNYRLDVLFGVRTLDGRLAVRVSGAP